MQGIMQTHLSLVTNTLGAEDRRFWHWRQMRLALEMAKPENKNLQYT